MYIDALFTLIVIYIYIYITSKQLMRCFLSKMTMNRGEANMPA